MIREKRAFWWTNEGREGVVLQILPTKKGVVVARGL
jgi:hypothetical protein